MLAGLVPRLIVATALSDFGSIRVTVGDALFAIQTDPSPTARSESPALLGTVPTTAF